MDAAALREQLLVNNIANIDTPDYKRSDLDFNAALRQAMTSGNGVSSGISGRRTRTRHIEIPQGGNAGVKGRKENWFVARNDENNVSIEVENASRDQNQLLYSAAVQLYGDRMKWLTAVLESRR